jgi:hypothetical protein
MVLPLVFAMYIANYMDRANVAFAKVPMTAELGFSEAVYGQGAGISPMLCIGEMERFQPSVIAVRNRHKRRSATYPEPGALYPAKTLSQCLIRHIPASRDRASPVARDPACTRAAAVKRARAGRPTLPMPQNWPRERETPHSALPTRLAPNALKRPFPRQREPISQQLRFPIACREVFAKATGAFS